MKSIKCQEDILVAEIQSKVDTLTPVLHKGRLQTVFLSTFRGNDIFIAFASLIERSFHQFLSSFLRLFSIFSHLILELNSFDPPSLNIKRKSNFFISLILLLLNHFKPWSSLTNFRPTAELCTPVKVHRECQHKKLTKIVRY